MAIGELASDCRKKPAAILTVVRRKANESLQSMRGELDRVTHQLEHASVPDVIDSEGFWCKLEKLALWR